MSKVKTLNPKQFKEAMETILEDFAGDTEAMHGKADDLMSQVLTDLGYKDGITLYEEMDKWYA